MQSLLVFRSFDCARHTRGHSSWRLGCARMQAVTSVVFKKTFWGKYHPRGGEPRKNNIAAIGAIARPPERKFAKKSVSEGICNLLKRNPVVKRENEGTGASCPSCSAYQRLGYRRPSIKRIHSSSAPAKLALSLSRTQLPVHRPQSARLRRRRSG